MTQVLAGGASRVANLSEASNEQLLDAAAAVASEVEELVERIGLLTLNTRLDAVRSGLEEDELVMALQASAVSAMGSLRETRDFSALLDSLYAHLVGPADTNAG